MALTDAMVDGITRVTLDAVSGRDMLVTSGLGLRVGNAPSSLVLRQAQQASAVGESVARLLELHAGGKLQSVIYCADNCRPDSFMLQYHRQHRKTVVLQVHLAPLRQGQHPGIAETGQP